jgi:hypothetical protein
LLTSSGLQPSVDVSGAFTARREAAMTAHEALVERLLA